ncbi:MAG TPA: hypothetical protein PLQ12_11025 [Candidatus Defluviicoccus seviourii]|nr:hypothetical protein [Candidatus Defluviicoccus seviourii]
MRRLGTVLAILVLLWSVSAQTDAKTDLRKLLEHMPMEQYIKLRKERPEVLGLKPLPKSGR